MSEDAPIIHLFSYLLRFVCWICGLVAFPVIAAFKLTAKFVTSAIFSPEPSGYRASHAFLWPFRLILALLGPTFLFLELGAFYYIGYALGNLMFGIILEIVGLVALYIGIVWANRGDGHFKFLPEFEFQGYWHGFIDSLFDLGAFFCLIVAILSVVRIPYLIRHLRTVDEPLRAKLFFEVPNALIELLMLPMYIVIFICHWRFYRYCNEMKDANKTSKFRWITVKHFLESLKDLPFYFLGFVSIIFFWRINYLIKKIKKCKFKKRRKVFRKNFLYGILDIPILPMLMIIFICHWKWEGFYAVYKKIKNSHYLEKYSCIITHFLSIFTDLFYIIIWVLTIVFIWRFIPLTNRIFYNTINPDYKLSEKEIKRLIIHSFFNGLIDCPFVIMLFLCAVAPWRFYILYKRYKESESDWETRRLIFYNLLAIPIDLLIFIIVLPQLFTWRIYYIEKDWKSLNECPTLTKDEWMLKLIILRNFQLLVIDLLVLIEFVLLFILFNWRFWVYLRKKHDKNNTEDENYSFEFFQFGWYYLVSRELINGLFDLPFIPFFIINFIFHWRFLSYNIQRKENQLLSNWELRLLVFQNFLFAIVDFFCLILAAIIFLTWRQKTFIQKFKQLKKANKENENLGQNDKENFIRLLIVSQFFNLFPDFICIVLSLLIFLTMWRIYWFVNSLRAEETAVGRRKAVMYHLAELICDIPFFILYVIISMSVYRLQLMNSDLLKYTEDLPKNNAIRRAIIVEHFALLIFDIFGLVCLIILFITYYRYQKYKTELSNLNRGVFSVYEENERMSRFQPHFLLFTQFFLLLIDSLFWILFLIMSPFLWRSLWCYKLLKETKSDNEKRLVVTVQFGYLLMDIPLVIPFILLIITYLRAEIILKRLKQIRNNEIQHTMHRYIIIEFIKLLFDLPFLPLIFIIIITLWRSKHFLKNFKKFGAKNEIKKKLFIIQQFFYWILDIPTFVIFLILVITYWRYPDLKSALQSALQSVKVKIDLTKISKEEGKEKDNDKEKDLTSSEIVDNNNVKNDPRLSKTPNIGSDSNADPFTNLKSKQNLKNTNNEVHDLLNNRNKASSWGDSSDEEQKLILNDHLETISNEEIELDEMKLAYNDNGNGNEKLTIINKDEQIINEKKIVESKSFGEKNYLNIFLVNYHCIIWRELFFLILDLPIIFLYFLCHIPFWRAKRIRLAYNDENNKTNNKMRKIIFVQGILALLDLPMFIALCITIVSWRGFRLRRLLFKNTLNEEEYQNLERELEDEVEMLFFHKLSLLINDIPKIIYCAYSNDQQSLIFHEFFALFFDIPFILLSIVSFWRLIAIYYRIDKLKEKLTIFESKCIIMEEFGNFLLDICFLPFFLVLMLTVYRFPKIYNFLKTCDFQKTTHIFIMKEFLHLLLDLPFIPLFLIIFFTIYRYNVLKKKIDQASSEMEKRMIILIEFMQLVFDLLFIILTIASFWRLIAIYYRIYKSKEKLTTFEKRSIIMEEFANFLFDVCCLPFFLVLMLTVYRFPNIYNFLKTCDLQKTTHIFIMKEFLHLLLDAPFIPMFLCILFTIYRYNGFKKRINQVSSETEKRAIILIEFIQLIFDLPIIPLYLIIMITYVRSHTLNLYLKKYYKHNMIRRWIILKNFLCLLLDTVCILLTFFIYLAYFRKKKYQDDLKNNGLDEFIVRKIILKHFVFLIFDLLNLILFIFISILFYWRSHLIQKKYANYKNNSFLLFCFIVVQLINGIMDFPFFLLFLLICAFSFWRFKSVKETVKKYDQNFATQFVIRLKILHNFILIPLDYITIIIGTVLLMTTRRFSLKKKWIVCDFNQQLNQFDGFNIFNLNNENGDYFKYVLVLIQTFLLFLDLICLLMYIVILITHWRSKSVKNLYKYLKTVQNPEMNIRSMILTNFFLLFYDIFCFILFVIVVLTWRNKLIIGELKLKNKMINENNHLKLYNININDQLDENDDRLKSNNDDTQSDKIIDNNDDSDYDHDDNNNDDEIIFCDQDLFSFHLIVIENFFGFLIDIPCVFLLIIIYSTLFRIKFYKNFYDKKKTQLGENEYEDQNDDNDEELKKIVNLKIKYSAFHISTIHEIFQWFLDLPFVVLSLFVLISWRSSIIIKIYKQEIYEDEWIRRGKISINFFLLFYDLVIIVIILCLLFINLFFVWRMPTLYSFIKRGFTDVERKGDGNYFYPKLFYFVRVLLKLIFLSLYDVISIILMLFIVICFQRIKPFITKFNSMKRARITEEPDQDIIKFYENGINAMEKYESIKFPTSLTYYRSLINYESLKSLILSPHLIFLPFKIIAYCLSPISIYIDWRFKNADDYINTVSLMRKPITKLNDRVKRNHTFKKIHWNVFIYFVLLAILFINEFSLIGLFFNWLLLLLLTWFEPFKKKNDEQEEHQIPLKPIIYFRNICYIPIILFYQFLIAFLPSFMINPSFNFSKTYSNVEGWFWAIQIIWFVLMFTSWYCLRRMVKRNFPSYQLFNSIIWMKGGCIGLFSSDFVLWRYFKATLIFPTIWLYKFSKKVNMIGDLLYSLYFVLWVSWPVALLIYCIRKFGNSNDYYYLFIVIPISLFLSYVGIKISRNNWSKNPKGFPKKKNNQN
ncbi:hypothetical protein M0813_01062 [Anaeramoeba flamelloides]|uniref:Uncharacterized protein n=1 Tax=Anaeramoeba flamelloides TaxID=1746091 RepID=A0ABQ8X0G2_9EUKA|nr:hypothetical protein M0813_01062 [Anaeramoeba flamelloides]